MRAEAPRFEHRHRRADAEGSRDVTSGRHDAALAATDNQRLVGQRRVVALLDRGVEGVAIDVADGEGVELRVAQDARREARGAAQGLSGVAQAIAAERGHHGRSRSQTPPRAARARSTSVGSMPWCCAKAISSGSFPEKWSSTPLRKLGSRAASRI